MPSPRRAAAAAAAAAVGGHREKSVSAVYATHTGKTTRSGRKGMSLPNRQGSGIYGIANTSRAAEGRTDVGTSPEVAESVRLASISSRKPAFSRSSGGSLTRTRHTLSSRQSLYKSVKLDSPSADCHTAQGGPPGTARGILGQPAGADDQQRRKGERSLMFESRLALRHGEYWTGKLSARRDAEALPEVLCAQYSALQQTLFIGLSTGVLLVWRYPFVAGPEKPEAAALVIKAREHTGAVSALAYHRKLEADRTPHHFQALQQLQGTQSLFPAPKHWETLPSWSTGCGKQRQQQQKAGTAAEVDQRLSATTAGRPTGMLLQAKELGVRETEDYSGVIFTGSADRCVKVWFVHEKKVECVKTLCFHGGTVVALAYCSPLLFSSSTDGTVLICRVDTAASALKYPQFTPVQRIFTHQSYHPSTKLVLSNKKVWYDSLAATRKDGDTIYLYCGATDGTVLALDNFQVLVPSNPIIGGGGAPPLCLRTEERAASTAASQKKSPDTTYGSISHNAAARYSAAGVCDPATWKDFLDGSSHGGDNNGNHGNATPPLTTRNKKSTVSAGGALMSSIKAIAGALLPVPFRIVKKFHVHSLSVRQLLCLPLDSVVASLGSEASVAVIDPLTAQVWWQNANPEGYCYSAFTWMPAFNLLLVGDDGGNLSFYNVYSRERVYSQQVTTSKIVTLGPGRTSLQVIAGTAHEFLVIDVVETSAEVQLQGHIGTVTNLHVRETTEGTYLYSAGDDHSIRVWDPVRGLCCRVIRHKHADITSWLFMESIAGFVTGHENGDVRFWTLKEFSSFSIHNAKGNRMHTNTVSSMCCWPIAEDLRGKKMTEREDRQGERSDAMGGGATDRPTEADTDEAFQVLSCGYDGRLNVFELRTDRDSGEVSTKVVDQLSRPSNKAAGNGEEILFTAAFPKNNVFFTAGNSPTITKWFTKTLTVDEELNGHQDAITALCKAGDHLLSGSADLSVRVWTVDPPHCICVTKTQSDPAVSLISFQNASETFWASMTWPGEISVWDNKWHLAASRKFQTSMNCFACSESLKLLFLGTDEGMIMTTPLPPCQKVTIMEKGRISLGVSFQQKEDEKPSQTEAAASESSPE